MAKYKAYSEYKDSGVEWLGAVPNDWHIIKLKYMADLLTAKPSHPDELFVGLENISSGDGKYISKEETIADCVAITFKKNDILFGKLRPYLAKSWLATFSGVCSSEFLVLRTVKSHPKFLNYYSLTNKFIEQVNSSTYGSKMPRASWEFIGLLPVPTCSYTLSEKIATFLNYETAKIDNLIEKQQQLIELLKEKRQAVISNAVTKGLNPDVPMKDSEVDYPQRIPTHWTLSKLRYTFIFSKGLTITKENLQDEGIPCINYGEIHSKYPFELNTNIHKLKYVNKLHLKNNINSLLYRGDIIFADTSEDIDGAGNFSQLINHDTVFAGYHTIIARPLNRDNFRFYAYLLDSNELRSQIRHAVKGIKVFSVTQAILRNLSIWMPSPKEQSNISTFLDNETTKIDTLIEKQLQQIALLKERRTALISAAVTGKIDVRHWHAPDEQTTTVAEVAV